MRKLIYFFLFFNLIGYSQCGITDVCNANTGIYSNDDASTIAYDNMGSAFHSSFIKEPDGGWKVWGEFMNNDGISSRLVPTSFTVENYPLLTGEIYKMAIGSNFGNRVQLVVLTSTGLFVLGQEGTVLDNSITTSNQFQKIVINGKIDGLPAGVTPENVKMMMASTSTLILTTCNGNVYVLSLIANVRGDGNTGNALQWSRVMQDETTPLSNVIVTRGNSAMGFALKQDGTLWTWGDNTYLGNGTANANRNFATQMTLPTGMMSVKMIQATSNNYILNAGSRNSYYILGTDKKVYSLGINENGQLGDRTVSLRLSWVNAKNPNNTIITDASWISTNEHDKNLSALAVIKSNGIIYTAGCNSYYMIGRTNGGDTIAGGVNYLDVPNGITITDEITFAETGGHTCALIKKCTSRYGYVGHRKNGSIGDGSIIDETIPTYDFNTPPIIAICGAQFIQPVITSNSPICPGENAIITITGASGDILTYKINGGPIQTITIQTNGIAQIIISNATINQQVVFSQIYSVNTVCNYDLSVTTNVELNIPVFDQVEPTCQGYIINALPTISLNGISGTWSPELNNQQTTTYTFTPNPNVCNTTVSMTIVVNEPNTSLPIFQPIAPICQYDEINPLPNVSENGIIGIWTPEFSNEITTTYTFIPTVNTCGQVAEITVVVNPKETPTFDLVGPFCEGTILQNLPIISIEGISGSWSPELNNQQTTTYFFTPDTSFCAYNTNLTIEILPKQNPAFEGIDPLCYGLNDFELPVTSFNGISGTWSPSFNATQSGSYTFIPNEDECANSASMEIQIREDFNFETNHYCLQNNFYLEINPINLNLTNSTINWTLNSVSISNDATFNVTNFINSTIENEVFPMNLVLEITNEFGCVKSKNIYVETTFCEIPNVITPNGDAFNNLLDLSLLRPNKIMIFNRWGFMVYNKDKYINEWYGQTNDNKMLPNGVYFYVVELNNEPTKTGWIQLVY